MRKLRNNLEEIPLHEPTVTMIIITGGTTMFSCTLQEKQQLMDLYFDLAAQVRKRAQVLAIWPGKTRSDVFLLTEDKLREFKHEASLVVQHRRKWAPDRNLQSNERSLGTWYGGNS